MINLVLRQLAFLVATLLIVSFGIFLLIDLSPTGAARIILGEFATEEQVRILHEQLGLDRPILNRYAEYIGGILQGDFGYSLSYRQPVADVLGSRLLATCKLALISFSLIVPLSVLLGVVAGMREGSVFDRFALIMMTLMASIPPFAMGVFLAIIFAMQLRWLPGTSPMVPSTQWTIAQQYVLPVIVIVIYDTGYVASMVRASMVDVMKRPFIRTAVLKGMSFPQVIWRHALRNALIGPITVILLQLNWLISGMVIIETLFAYPGFGSMMLRAALMQDYALLAVGGMVAVLLAIFTQIASDVTYTLIDPRLRNK